MSEVLYSKSISYCQWHAMEELVDNLSVKVNTVMRMVETVRKTDSSCSSSIPVDSCRIWVGSSRFWSFLQESKGQQEELSIKF